MHKFDLVLQVNILKLLIKNKLFFLLKLMIFFLIKEKVIAIGLASLLVDRIRKVILKIMVDICKVLGQ